jgi:hypothetical protein
VFCGPACRTAFHTAARRWAERVVDAGFLTVDHIRSGDPTACTLLPCGISPAPIGPAQKPAPASPESPDEAAELLYDLIVGLLDNDKWLDLATALPDELVERLCDWAGVE